MQRREARDVGGCNCKLCALHREEDAPCTCFKMYLSKDLNVLVKLQNVFVQKQDMLVGANCGHREEDARVWHLHRLQNIFD